MEKELYGIAAIILAVCLGTAAMTYAENTTKVVTCSHCGRTTTSHE